MSNIDNIFLKVLTDKDLAEEFNINTSRIRNLDEGKRSVNPQVRAIADIIDQLNKKISEVKSDMNIRRIDGPVVLNEADYQAIYKKVVASLSK